ncbi:MAG: tetratricopeptide repeat protein [Rhodothermales bacterium]
MGVGSIVSLGFMVVTLAGCSGDRLERTLTEELRRKVDPKVQKFLLEGERSYHTGKFLTALSMADSAAKFAPNLADVHFLRAKVYSDLQQFEMAEVAYEAALQADPEYPGAHMNKGINLVRQGALREAIEEFRKEEAIKPNSSMYLELGKTYAKLGSADSAALAYEQAIALDTTNASALMWVGQLYEELGDVDKALAYSRRGAKLRPENLDYKYLIGSLLFRMGEVEEALSNLKPVADERTWHHGAQYNTAQALLRTGDEKAAQVYLEKAEMAQKMQQAINEAKEAINRDPDDVRNWIKLGDAHRNAKMYDRAVDAFKVAVAYDPANLSLQMNLATLILESGDSAEAARRYRAILQIDSTVTDAWLNLGAAYGNAGNHEEARKAWQRVLTMEPGNRRARALLTQLKQLAEAK